MKNKSKKHHYLPRKYLNGFCDNQNVFFVYDKKNDKVFRNTPDNTFFEKHLNTVQFPDGKTSDFLEGLYSHMERQSWDCLDNIRLTNNQSSIDPLDKASLYFFLLILHWRLPNNLEYVDKLVGKSFSEDKVLNFFSLKYKNGDDANPDIKKLIKTSDAFKKAFKLLLPFTPFHKNPNWSSDLANWRFLYPRKGKGWFIVGDNPIITEGALDNDPVNCLNEFIFPVSSEILLVNLKQPLTHGMPPEFILDYSMCILHRSERFVAGPNKDFLEALIERYKLFLQFQKTDVIIPDLFKSLNS